ncbi:type II toxin-antitoxin system death-on-curing family toxin [Porphyrobacter sp. SLTP]|jgi:death-on-curing protein|uniref:type II toxin-antitoxin system death-on-curing family toxin n=1 Tax=Porphyrobacter sp. SLTP TaxID=2683266 RepID=UPI0014129B80|nr:type II toxin-antitoxin system death-on-curing family toxin [Porphyrobacter sp. SLTP]NBB26266.1 type II toxin-antitoxin system death-on-curing family toxin [Porphyrobacter sp. SLTP]
MAGWRWVSHRAALTAHAEQIAEHGGGTGVRDMGLFESAMARPQQLEAYGEPDAAALAAAYAFGLARNHPFVDGNKRTANVVSLLFLLKNGWRVEADDADMTVAFIALAAGELSEDELADWFRQRVVALS